MLTGDGESGGSPPRGALERCEILLVDGKISYVVDAVVAG
jgi:hypothetical protein